MNFRTFLLIFLIVLSIFLVKYIGFGFGDMVEHLIIVYHDSNPENFKNDWFARYSEQFSIRDSFSKLLNFVNGIIGNYEVSSILILFICVLVFSLGYYKVMLSLTKNHKLAIFSLIFATGVIKPAIGANSFDIGSILIASRIALALIIWVFYYFLKEKYFTSFLLLGFSSLIHFSHAYIVYGVLMFALILKKSDLNKGYFDKSELKKKLKYLLKSVSFYIFFLISLIPLISGYMGLGGAIDPDKIMYIYQFRAPHHFSVFSWGWELWGILIITYLLLAISFYSSKFEEKQKRAFKPMILCILIFNLIQLIFVELIPSAFIMKVNLFRVNEFFDIIISFFIIEFAFYKIVESKKYLGKLYNHKNKKAMLNIIAVSLIILLILDISYVIYFSQKVSELLFIRISTIAAMLYLGVIYFIDNKKIKWILILFFAIALIAYLFYNPLIGRYQYDKAATELYNFVKEKTPQDAVFLIPPEMLTFRTGTIRAVVVDFKTVPMSDGGMVEWYERILDVTKSQDQKYKKESNFNEMKKGYNLLNEADIIELKKKYGFDYALFEKGKNLNFERVHENEKFVLYKL